MDNPYAPVSVDGSESGRSASRFVMDVTESLLICVFASAFVFLLVVMALGAVWGLLYCIRHEIGWIWWVVAFSFWFGMFIERARNGRQGNPRRS
jgi:hypothetical protein